MAKIDFCMAKIDFGMRKSIFAWRKSIMACENRFSDLRRDLAARGNSCQPEVELELVGRLASLARRTNKWCLVSHDAGEPDKQHTSVIAAGDITQASL